MTGHADDITRRSDELDERLRDLPLDEAVAKLIESGKRERFLTRIAIGGLVFDLIFSVVTGWIILRTHANLEQAQTNRAAIRNGCIIGNDNRTRERIIWGRVLAESLRGEEQPTRAEFEQIISFRQFIDDVTEPVDCQALGEGENGVIPPSIPPLSSAGPRTPGP